MGVLLRGLWRDFLRNHHLPALLSHGKGRGQRLGSTIYSLAA